MTSTGSSHKAQIRLNTRLLPVLVIAFLLLQIVIPYAGWMIFLVGLGGMWLIAFWWARALARGLNLKREIRYGWAQVGDRLEERFTLINTSAVPGLWVQIVDHSTLPDYQVSKATGVGGESDNWWRTEGQCTRRGSFRLGPTTLRTGDPFGIYTVEKELAGSTSLLVMPPVVPLPTIQVAPGRHGGDGRLRAHGLEPTMSFAGLREYVPGDNPRWVHWPTLARRDSLTIRMFDSAAAGAWWIVLDTEQRVQAGEGQNSTLEHGVILAASLAAEGIRSRRAVGFVAQSKELVWLPPRVGEHQRWEILRSLAVVEPAMRPLEEMVAALRPALQQLDSIIVITPNAEGCNWVNLLLPFQQHGAAPTVLLLDPISFGGSVDAERTLVLLAQLGIARYLITRDLLDRPEIRPGRRGRWDWKVTPSGRAIAVQKPQDSIWRSLE